MKKYYVVVENLETGKQISFTVKARDLSDAHMKGAEKAIDKGWWNYSIQAEEK